MCYITTTKIKVQHHLLVADCRKRNPIGATFTISVSNNRSSSMHSSRHPVGRNKKGSSICRVPFIDISPNREKTNK